MLLGAPRDTMTLLHHVEHVASFPRSASAATKARSSWMERKSRRWFEEFQTTPGIAGSDHYFATIVTAYLATGRIVGEAETVIVDAASITAFAVAWMGRRRFRYADRRR